METRKSFYNLALYVIIASLLAVVVWQFIAAQRERTRESQLVEKYGPPMQQICDDLGVKIKINDFADILNAFEQITMKTQSSDHLEK